jgi:hypothetical protein
MNTTLLISSPKVCNKEFFALKMKANYRKTTTFAIKFEN